MNASGAAANDTFDSNENASSGLTLRDLLFAYRKAKADCFFERMLLLASEFAHYERDLEENLRRVAALVEEATAGADIESVAKKFFDDKAFEEMVAVLPKSIGARGPQRSDDDAVVTGVDARYSRLTSQRAEVAFRLVGRFPIGVHVLSALWINKVGHRLDEQVCPEARGARLRRLRPETCAPPGAVGDYHLYAVGSFEPYFRPYREWREGALRAMERELDEKRDVVAVSMDIASFYHCVDVNAFKADAWLARFRGARIADQDQRTNTDEVLSRLILEVIALWAKQARQRLEGLGVEEPARNAGLPIGLSASRVLANALLGELDEAIKHDLRPLHYGRYVDDILLVFPKLKDVTSTATFYDWAVARSGPFHAERVQTDCTEPERNASRVLRFELAHGEQTRIEFNAQKSRLFLLDAEGGRDVLEAVRRHAREASSERRFIADGSELEAGELAATLSLGHSEVTTLRKADDLSMRRLAWAIKLRRAEQLAELLPPKEWNAQRQEFFGFTRRRIYSLDEWFSFFDYLGRVEQLAIAMQDWTELEQLICASDRVMRQLRELLTSPASKCVVRVNGACARAAALDWLADALMLTVNRGLQESLLRALEHGTLPASSRVASEILRRLPERDLTTSELATRANEVAEVDFGRTPYKARIGDGRLKQRRGDWEKERALWEAFPLSPCIREFFDECVLAHTRPAAGYAPVARVPSDHERDCCAKFGYEERDADDEVLSVFPYVFPTRPYDAREVALFVPHACGFVRGGQGGNVNRWHRYVRALRGIAEREPDQLKRKDDSAVVMVARRDAPWRLALANMLVEDAWWSGAAAGKPVLTTERLKAVANVVNTAIRERATHVVLPELALPRGWLGTISARLQQEGISLIAGLEYAIDPKSHHALNDVAMVFTDERWGFRAAVELRQRKVSPAPRESLLLQRDHGLTFPPRTGRRDRPIYEHAGIRFGVLVCSELLDIDARARLRGKVDALVVVAWNQDVETFSALVESAALDIHASVVVVNNRKYGDSRVRVPRKKDHERERCRVRGGGNDLVAIVEIEADELRAFQSRALGWPAEDDPFKPVPAGFEMNEFRKTTPR